MVLARLHTPSWRQGFARYRRQPAYPGLWDGLAGAWLPALGPTGSTLRDISGRGNHGTLTSMDPATDWGTTNKRGLPWGLEFDGSANYVNCGNQSSLSMTDQVSFGGWAYLPVGGAGTLWGKNYLEYDCEFREASTRILAFFGDGSSSSVASWTLASLALNQWHHIIVTLTKSTGVVHLWLDGVRQVERSTTPRGSGGSNNFNIGRRTLGSKYFGGSIGAVHVYNRILAPDEIRTLYRDRLALVRRRAMVFPADVTAVPGPYDVAAGLPYVAGSVAGDAYTTGSVAGDVYTTGSVTGALT